MKYSIMFVCFLLATGVSIASELKDCISEEEFRKFSFPMSETNHDIWVDFYCCSSEAGNISILVEAGKRIVPDILNGIQDRRMYKRRYALKALGYLGDASEIKSLKTMLNDPTEPGYIQGLALEAIYVIDQNVGIAEAKRVLNSTKEEDVYKNRHKIWSAEEIIKEPNKIKLKWVESSGPSGIRVK